MVDKITKSKLKLGKRIQRARKRLHLSQEDLAERVKISRTHMGHVEQGRKSPSIKLLEKLAKALKINTSNFF